MSEIVFENVWQKLNYVQTKLEAKKGQWNSFSSYNYRSNEDILESLKPLLAEVGAVILQSDAIKVMTEQRIYVEATSSFVCVDTGDRVENTSYAREALTKKGMDDAQVTGATSSYARKYSLNGLFAIDDSKDADSADNRDKGETGGNSNNTYDNPPEDKEWLNDTSKLLGLAKTQGLTGEEAVKKAREIYKVSNKVKDEILSALA